MKEPITELLKQKETLISDGAMATELEKLGVNTANDLWSAAALLTEPAKITQVHRSYFAAGAMIATTNTYQANFAAFQKRGFNQVQFQQLIKQAVDCARQAQSSAKIPNETLVAGSVGPYGAYLADGSEYTGNYQLTEAEFQNFHYLRIKALLAAQVDVLAIETQPKFAEVQALVKLLAAKFSQTTAWISFSIKDPQHLCDGTLLAQAATWLNDQQQISAVGINCTDLLQITPALQTLKKYSVKPLIVYPNNGDEYDPVTKQWQAKHLSQNFSDLVPQWQKNGARIIGGCCRTTPTEIAAIAQTVAKK
ncbi:homocysteine S-methyltransferase [Liquorilactobacillus vini]|uniref:S-methylmethionine:homocysteine methyltransferase n=1 Tax=Liquorilactobacillus vini DSM 20605 TaxID=1133569 RepID=A0A0R2CC53_9LACO|nr:homocysteine S-methyltransferase [Liquorilactobacillus vini]KRM88690.1 homocysteine methyltransferase [Liquorilactobacillus vini DSM 20605]